MLRRAALAATMIAAQAASLSAQEHVHAGHDHAPAGEVKLIEGLGDWTLPVRTAVPAAQQFFDQGLRLSYAFNHAEAIRSFEEALRLDPTCAMCAWGIAYALSPNINAPMSAEAESQALAAIRRAQSLVQPDAQYEKDMIAALALRFGEPVGESRAQRDSAYASAMRNVARKYADDIDAQVMFADAMLNLRPWNQWLRDGRPQPGTLEVVDVLERALRKEPNHAGACHFYIHTVEASQDPERALPCADRLAKLMPGAGHLVHMPAHVYLRVGMYERAARANIAAVEADRGYFAKHDPAPGVYPLFYHPHNIHFLWAAYMMSGQRAKSMGAAEALLERVSQEMAAEEVSLQAFLVPVVLTPLRFSEYEEVLGLPSPDPSLVYVKGAWHYARGVANAQLGRLVDAAVELDSLRAIVAGVPEDMIIITNSAKTLLRIAELVLAARIEAATGSVDAALPLLNEAIALEDGLVYDEPPPWYQPVRQILGEVLLNAQRWAAAEQAFREDLRWMRENGWSLAGLEQALRAQGRTEEAKAVAKRLEEAWRYADVSPLPRAPRVRFGEAPLRTGARIRWAESGDRTGAAVVMLHGYSDSWFSFSPLIPLLPENLRVIAVDMRGQGESGDVPASFRVDELASDVVALMDQLGILRATVVGHSYGSLVAQAVFATAPSRVEKLVLMGAVSRGSLPSLSELRDVIVGLPDPMPAEFAREFQQSTITQPVHPWFLERVIGESRKLSKLAWAGIADGWQDADYRDELAAAQPPTLILWGDRDQYFKRDVQDELVAALPNARFVTFEGVGHAVHWEEPRGVAEELIRFIAPDVVAGAGGR